MVVEKSYPYQDLSLTDLPDERWSPIEGFEDRYEISSYGRVKALAWDRVAHHGSLQRIGERIRKVKMDTKSNKHMKDLLYSLLISVKMDGIAKHFSVGRLVYNAFVAPFDLEDTTLFISYKDGNGRNVHYKNLFMTNLSEMSFHSYAIGRAQSHLSVLSKPVGQFDTNGKLIRQFKSMYEAGKIAGFNNRSISSIANGSGYLSNGYCWQFGKRKTLKPDTLPLNEETSGINESLIAKLGIVRVADPTPAIFDLSLKSRPGERWKDFPGYEGLYEISSHGRMKALKKVSEGKLKKWYPEKIKCLTVEINEDKSGNPKPGSACVTLCKNHKKKSYYVARWTYHLFVKPFDTSNSSLRVYCKDGNNLNMVAGNLELHNAAYSINGNRHE